MVDANTISDRIKCRLKILDAFKNIQKSNELTNFWGS